MAKGTCCAWTSQLAESILKVEFQKLSGCKVQTTAGPKQTWAVLQMHPPEGQGKVNLSATPS